MKPSSAERYKTSLRMLDPHFGDMHLDQITRKEIGRYVLARKAKASNATIRRDLSALSRMLSCAVALGLTETNAAREWDRSVIKAPRKPFVRIDQRSFDFVVARAPGAFGALLRFLLATGMRENEATILRRKGDIDPLTGQLTIDGKRGVRTITLSPAALQIARSAPAHISSPFIFWTPDGGRYKTAWSIQARLCASAQKAAQREGWAFRRFNIHGLRHEFAIRWLENSGRLYALQRHLGHSSIRQTEEY
ncbi:MAG TPA: tyrosine-type recombinase/integrase, partial [Caulobacterales bacterium]|nr:tyrosine-type recombinase/integrase [Caulobacterales bacterium]